MRYETVPALLNLDRVPGSQRAGKLEVRLDKCTSTSFMPETDGIVTGHIGSPDGKPFTVHPSLQIVSLEHQRSASVYVDANGYYEARDVEPGRYVVGMGYRVGVDPKCGSCLRPRSPIDIKGNRHSTWADRETPQ